MHSSLPDIFDEEARYPLPCQFPEWSTNPFNRQALIYFTLAEIAELPVEARPKAFEDDMVGLADERVHVIIMREVGSRMAARGLDMWQEGPCSSFTRAWTMVSIGHIGPGKKPPPPHQRWIPLSPKK